MLDRIWLTFGVHFKITVVFCIIKNYFLFIYVSVSHTEDHTLSQYAKSEKISKNIFIALKSLPLSKIRKIK